MRELAEKEDHGCLFAKNLYNTLSNESFQNQNKYQNILFYEEFEILTKQKKPDQNEENIEEDKNDVLSIFKERVSNNLMASFISSDSISIHN